MNLTTATSTTATYPTAPAFRSRLAALAESDLKDRTTEVAVIADAARVAGVPTPIVEAWVDPATPLVVRRRALMRIAARLEFQPAVAA